MRHTTDELGERNYSNVLKSRSFQMDAQPAIVKSPIDIVYDELNMSSSKNKPRRKSIKPFKSSNNLNKSRGS